MNHASRIPRPALILGWLGVLPFAALTLLAAYGSDLPGGAPLGLLVLYGAIILSFMGGAQWGLAMVTAAEDAGALARRLAISVMPALAGFGLWFAPPKLAALGLAASFVLLLAYDRATARAGTAPPWYPALRLQLTLAVIACLLLAAAFGRS